jgi:hypothetical protein
MKRAIVAAALVGAVLVGAILSQSGNAQQPGERTFTLIERGAEGSFHIVNNPPRGERSPFQGGPISAGDELIFHQPVRNEASRRVGALDVSCTESGGGRNFEKAQFICHGAFSLRQGTITLEASFRGGDDVVNIAITGGTGVYEGAQGSVRSIFRQGRTVDVVHLLG